MSIQNMSVGFITRALSLQYTQNNPSLCFGFPSAHYRYQSPALSRLQPDGAPPPAHCQPPGPIQVNP